MLFTDCDFNRVKEITKKDVSDYDFNVIVRKALRLLGREFLLSHFDRIINSDAEILSFEIYRDINESRRFSYDVVIFWETKNFKLTRRFIDYK